MLRTAEDLAAEELFWAEYCSYCGTSPCHCMDEKELVGPPVRELAA